MSVTVRSYRPQVRQRFQQAFVETAHAYNAQLHQVIRTARQWPPGFGTTRRRSGEVVVGSYRNLYDLGNLDSSQQMTLVSPFRAEYRWSGNGVTPPAVVHEGAVTRTGRRIPARRFTRLAAKEANLPARFAGAFRRAA